MKSTGCQTFALAPDGEFMGLGDCRINFSAGIYGSVEWSRVELLSIQAQRLVSESSAGKLTVEDDATFVTRVASYVRAKNPAVRVVTQVSLRYTTPEQIFAAMGRVAAVVDGFYVVYPAHSTKPYRYCSPESLAAVLQARDAR